MNISDLEYLNDSITSSLSGGIGLFVQSTSRNILFGEGSFRNFSSDRKIEFNIIRQEPVRRVIHVAQERPSLIATICRSTVSGTERSSSCNVFFDPSEQLVDLKDHPFFGYFA